MPTAGNGRYSAEGQGLGNEIDERVAYITEKMDQIMVAEAKTTGMTADSALVQAASESGSIKLATIQTTGLGDYNLAQGYPVGNLSLKWTSYELEYDRALKLVCDKRQQIESGGLATIAAASAEFVRSEVVPELDASRMSRLATAVSTYAPNNYVSGVTPTAANIVTKIIEGLDAVSEETGYDEGMTIYVNGSLRSALNRSTEVGARKAINDTNKTFNSAIMEINGNPIVFVPAKRMYSVFNKQDGYTNALSDKTDLTKTDKTKYGWSGSGAPINFAITTPGVANAVTAINETKYIPGERSEQFSGDSFMCRIWHDLIVPKNKAVGAFVSVGTAPAGSS